MPAWSWAPLSGEGAARFGGRWNARGQAAIYGALELATAWSEYNQGLSQHPGLVARLHVRGARLADVRDADLRVAHGVPDDLGGDSWRAAMTAAGVAPTQAAALRMMAAGYDGLLAPSFMAPGGKTAVLWRWNRDGAPGVMVEDPEGRLPRDGASWSG
ncbi:RES family NAD+ phosphorylase [Sandaracinobacteroides saxicola]|uniref:RES family NAD+ phosphorylase n=1 Tax=Sandaracinobacteroides saxicola TaxID=2759707 RepID=UPI001A9C6946|nr:RES domain-containing protein [Sandaracinobacteroides saxicola]